MVRAQPKKSPLKHPAARTLGKKIAPERGSAAICSRQDDVRERVLLMIQKGELRPCDRINEYGLSTLVGVGRNIVREALRALEKSGMVRIIPNRGAYVSQLSLEDVLDLYDIRAGLARTCGRLITVRHTDEDLRVLDELIAKMDECASRRDSAGYAELNGQFHRAMMQATKNPRLVEIGLTIEDQLQFLLRKGVFSLFQMQASHSEHREIIEMIRSGNADKAGRLLENHILVGKQRMLDTMVAAGRYIGRS